MSEQIIPLYLYQNKNTLASYLSYEKQNTDEKSPLKDEEVFYVIDPKFRPLPYGTEIFCAKSKNMTCTSLSGFYDPFNEDEVCLKFICWNDPAPYTAPLYVYHRLPLLNDGGDYLIFSFSKLDMNELEFSPIHVIVSFPSKYPTLDLEGKFTGIPKTFSSYQGRCLLDPKGTSLQECVEKKVDKSQPLFLNFLKNEDGFGIGSFFIFLFLFVIILLIVLFYFR